MSDPLRTDAARAAGRPDGADKEARIEQLLLSGLDRYFAGEYEQAINIWTRVVFLERGHSRARAYIERARGALAERHRESEELLHRGIAAFNDGQTEAARDLITRAVEHGGQHDMALGLLERLNRLATPSVAPASPSLIETDGNEAHPTAEPRHPRSRRGTLVIIAIGAIAVVAALVIGPNFGGRTDLVHPPLTQAAAMVPEPLPVARATERVVARARAAQAAGDLRDALRILDAIDVADPLRPEADRLRGELQRQLLGSRATEGPR